MSEPTNLFDSPPNVGVEDMDLASACRQTADPAEVFVVPTVINAYGTYHMRSIALCGASKIQTNLVQIAGKIESLQKELAYCSLAVQYVERANLDTKIGANIIDELERRISVLYNYDHAARALLDQLQWISGNLGAQITLKQLVRGQELLTSREGLMVLTIIMKCVNAAWSRMRMLCSEVIAQEHDCVSVLESIIQGPSYLDIARGRRLIRGSRRPVVINVPPEIQDSDRSPWLRNI